jgi:nucleoside phosphorylase
VRTTAVDDDAPLIVTAVASETRAVLAAVRRARRIAAPGFRAWSAEADGRAIRIVQAGIGPARARAALHAIPGRPPFVVSVGFAGGLTSGSRPGDVVLPTTVVWSEPTGIRRYAVPKETWQAMRARVPSAAAARLLDGALFSSDVILASPEEKRTAGVRFEAVAVEMEAAGLIDAAADRGASVVPLRVVLDGVDVSLADLPPNLDTSWAARAQLLARPDLWGRVLALARTVPEVARVLTATLAAVLPAL